MQIVYRPTMKQRRSAMLRCGTYCPCYAKPLWAPLSRVQAESFDARMRWPTLVQP